jgi:hypothetical protein
MKNLFRVAALSLLFVQTPSAFAANWASHIPQGWKLLDAVADAKAAVLIIEQDDPANRVKNEQLGMPELNTNPRQMVFLTKSASGFQKVGSADAFLPPAGDVESTCLADPLEEGGIALKNGVLTIDLNYWLSCGSYGVTKKTYKFRFQGGRYRLIGYDNFSYSRSKLEAEQSSRNYLTGKRKRVTGIRMDDEAGAPPEKTVWQKVPREAFYLDAMDRKACDDYENGPSWCGE